MQAVVISQPGGPEVLKLQEVSIPQPAKDEVRVRVFATGVNRVDILQRMGHYPAPAGASQEIPGVEFAGVVDALGEGITDFVVGERVFGLASGGAYAQYLIVNAQTLVRMPDNLSFVEGAAIPEAFITAYDAICSQGKLMKNETLLVHAVGSGVGIAAVQIAKLLGANVIGTARTQDKLDAAKSFGLDHGVLITDAVFADTVLKLTSKNGVNLVLELVGGKYITEDILCTANRGRIIVVGLVADSHADLDFGLLLRKRLEIRGTTLRSRPLNEKIQVSEIFKCEVVPYIQQGYLRPVVDKVFPLNEAGAAHNYVAANNNFGKVVLEIS